MKYVMQVAVLYVDFHFKGQMLIFVSSRTLLSTTCMLCKLPVSRGSPDR